MLRRLALIALLLVALLPLVPTAGLAQDLPAPPASEAADPADDATAKADAAKTEAERRKAEEEAKKPDVERMATLLTGIFALAAVLEAALAVIFAWPLFLDRINRRNAKMPISLVFSFFVAWGFDLQLVTKLAKAFGANAGGLPNWFDALISALILAGGAAGVRNLMVTLGLAKPFAELERLPRPPNNKAWLSIRDSRSEKVEPLTIWLGGTDAAGIAFRPRIIGSIAAGNKARQGLARMFLPDRSRFPVVAGYAVDVGPAYDIYVQQGSQTPAGNPVWAGYAFGEAAIVDLVYSDRQQ